MKSFKKITATALALTMITASSLTAFAEPGDEGDTPETENPTTEETVADPTSGGLGGNGTIEGVVKKDVFKVVLPTTDENTNTFDYRMDPQGLIAATDKAAYGEGYTFAEGASVFFQNKDKEYSATSNALTITNRSTMAVNVTLTAKVDEVSGLTMADSATFDAADTATELYLALIGGEGESAQTKAITTSGVTITAEMAAAPAEAYKAAYVDGEYVYALTDAASAEDYAGFATYSFKLTGACNTNAKADWTELKEANPRVDVVWTVTDPTAQVNIVESDGTEDIVIYYDGEKPSGIKLTPPSTAVKNTAVDLAAGTNVTVDDEKITIKASYIATLKKSANYGAGAYKVTVNGKDTTITIK